MKGLTSNENNTAREAPSSRKQELRLLVETIPALMGRTGLEGNAEFVALLQATLNVLPAYTWYSDPSGGLTFVNKRTADYLGLPEDHPLRFGIDIGAPLGRPGHVVASGRPRRRTQIQTRQSAHGRGWRA